MKRFLLVIPIGLLAMTGIFWVVTEKSTPKSTQHSTVQIPLGERELFAQSEHALRQIVWHGDEKSILLLRTSLDTMKIKLAAYKKQGFGTTKLENMLSLYQEDSTLLSEKLAPLLSRLYQYDQFEQSHEEPFIVSIDQIGLYELKSAYHNLDLMRKNYVKEPTDTAKMAYETEHARIRGIISELYLDAAIEKPLFTYLDNHKNYFDAITVTYKDIGYERINRLRTNAYAIKSELQLLPSI